MVCHIRLVLAVHIIEEPVRPLELPGKGAAGVFQDVIRQLLRGRGYQEDSRCIISPNFGSSQKRRVRNEMLKNRGIVVMLSRLRGMTTVKPTAACGRICSETQLSLKASRRNKSAKSRTSREDPKLRSPRLSLCWVRVQASRSATWPLGTWKNASLICIEEFQSGTSGTSKTGDRHLESLHIPPPSLCHYVHDLISGV